MRDVRLFSQYEPKSAASHAYTHGRAALQVPRLREGISPELYATGPHADSFQRQVRPTCILVIFLSDVLRLHYLKFAISNLGCLPVKCALIQLRAGRPFPCTVKSTSIRRSNVKCAGKPSVHSRPIGNTWTRSIRRRSSNATRALSRRLAATRIGTSSSWHYVAV